MRKNKKPLKRVSKHPHPLAFLLTLCIISGIAVIFFTWNKYFNNPSESGTQSPDPTLYSSEVSDITDQISPVPSVTDAPDPTATLKPDPTATSQPEISLTPTPKPTGTPAIGPIDVSGLSNDKKGWWYTPGGSPGVPATIQQPIADLLADYDGLWQGNTSLKNVYITMDVGYEYNNNTTKILDIAKEKNFKINFFITGTILKDSNLRQLAVRMNNEGHLVGNHSYNHPSFPVLLGQKGVQSVVDEMKLIEDSYYALTGTKIAPFMRPPMGEYSEATTYIMQQLGYKSVFWSFAYRDWLTDDQPDEAYALDFVTKNLHNGSILLLHTVSNTNVKILPELIDIIRERGYIISLLDELK